MLELKTEWKKIDLGDDVSVEIKPLNLRSYHRVLAFLMPHMAGDEGNVDAQAIMLEPALPDLLETEFTDHVKDVKGVTLNGETATPLNMTQTGQLLPQCVAVLGELLAYSTLGKEEVGN